MCSFIITKSVKIRAKLSVYLECSATYWKENGSFTVHSHTDTAWPRSKSWPSPALQRELWRLALCNQLSAAAGLVAGLSLHRAPPGYNAALWHTLWWHHQGERELGWTMRPKHVKDFLVYRVKTEIYSRRGCLLNPPVKRGGKGDLAMEHVKNLDSCKKTVVSELLLDRVSLGYHLSQHRREVTRFGYTASYCWPYHCGSDPWIMEIAPPDFS